MNGFPKKEIVDAVRAKYPPGSEVVLVRMQDSQAPPKGTKGTVKCVDDIGTVHVSWENGSSLGIAYGEDVCERL